LKRTSEGRLRRDFCISNDDYDEFNQLKYVCKTLLHETKDLEVELNDLAFCSQSEDMHADIHDKSQMSNQVSGARLLRDFAPLMPSSSTSRNIYIQGLPRERDVTPDGAMESVSLDFDDEDISPLFGLCQSHRNLMIYMDILGCNASDLDLDTFLSFASHAIDARHKGIIKELVPVFEHLNHLDIYPVDFWDLAKIAQKEWPGNFRLKPQGDFDERSFQNKVEEQQIRERYASLDVDKLCAIAAQWHIYGFFGEEERSG
jgi:hypothetical protein